MESKNKILETTRQKIATLIALAIIPLSGFATDIYLPSLPQMEIDLKVTSIQIQMTLSIFLISYGVAQLFIGAILDSFGRYHLGLFALLLFAIASVLIAITNCITIVYTMRAIQGVTAATVVVAKRAYFVDIYTGNRLKHYLSLFTVIWSVGPIVAPFIGGFIQSSLGWNYNFYFLAILAVILAVMEIIFSRETLINPFDFNMWEIANTYYKMLTTHSFTLGLLMLGVAYSMVMIYNLSGPFIIEHHFNYSPVIIGYCSLVLGFAWLIGGLIGKATININFIKKLLITHILQFIFAILMILCLYIIDTIYSLLFFAFIIHLAAGYTFNNYFTFNMGQFPKNAGIAGGLIGGIVYIIVSLLTSMILFVFPAKDQQNLSLSYLILIVLSLLIMYVILKTNRKDLDI